ncbi:MAG: hypothetical protein IT220_02445 [Flavobacteriaceae bacterium]|nr:hypothetical protein [Flavobacteriaceae bacterium]
MKKIISFIIIYSLVSCSEKNEISWVHYSIRNNSNHDLIFQSFDIDNNSILTLQIESMQMKTEIANYDINPYILNANKIVIKFDDEHIITYVKDNVNNQLINNPFLGNNENIIGGFYQNQEDCFYIISDEDYERSN